MKIQVIACNDKEIEIDTSFGVISGTWVGDLPDTNSIKDIEIELEDILEWNKDILKVTTREFECGNENGKTFFIGCIEAIEDDGFTVVRFGDSVFTIDTIGSPFSIGEFIKIEVVRLDFYDTGL